MLWVVSQQVFKERGGLEELDGRQVEDSVCYWSTECWDQRQEYPVGNSLWFALGYIGLRSREWKGREGQRECSIGRISLREGDVGVTFQLWIPPRGTRYDEFPYHGPMSPLRYNSIYRWKASKVCGSSRFDSMRQLPKSFRYNGGR